MRDWLAWARYIREHEAVPFAYDASGQDCIRFAAGAVHALTGIDHLAGLKPWKGRGGARMQIGRIGKGHGLDAAVSTRIAPIAPALAHRGDIAGIDHAEFGLMIMVIEGVTLVGPGTRGLIRAPRSQMVQAWSAGG